MAFPSDRSDDSAEQTHSAGEPFTEESSGKPEGSPSTSEDESVECPNCGRTFVGTYCPDCGQAVGQSVTMGEIAGDAFREIADIEGGFRATLVGLTLRPSQVLRKYLSGARRQFMSPGRYLTVAVLLYIGTVRGLSWLGLRQGMGEGIGEMFDPSGGDPAFREFMNSLGQLTQSEWFALVATLLTAGMLALIFWRLFGEKLQREAEALAVAVFLVAHASLLSTGVRLVFMPFVYFWSGHPTNPALFSGIGTLITVFYPAVAAHKCFGTGWKSAVKAVLGAFWAYIEAVGVGSIIMVWYLVWTLPNFPESIADGNLQTAYVVMGIISVFYLIPFFIHAGVETYYRLR